MRVSGSSAAHEQGRHAGCAGMAKEKTGTTKKAGNGEKNVGECYEKRL